MKHFDSSRALLDHAGEPMGPSDSAQQRGDTVQGATRPAGVTECVVLYS